jgi:hypothetical protein
MAKQVLKVKLDGAPELTATGEVKNLADLRKLFAKAITGISAALKVLPAIGECKVESVSIRPEHGARAAHSSEPAAA